MRRRGWLTLASLAGLFFTGAAAAHRLPKVKSPYDLRGAVSYSNLCVDDETDDVSGLRIFVRPAGAAPRVLFQYAEGGLPTLQAASIIVGRARLSFEADGDVPGGKVTGEVRDGFILLRTFPPKADQFRLRRRDDRNGAPS